MGIGFKIGIDIGSKLGTFTLGEELLNNGDFSGGITGWATGTGISVTNGVMTFDASLSATANTFQALPSSYIGKRLFLKYKINTKLDSGTFNLWSDGTTIYPYLKQELENEVGVFTEIIYCTLIGSRFQPRILGGVGILELDYISLKEIL